RRVLSGGVRGRVLGGRVQAGVRHASILRVVAASGECEERDQDGERGAEARGELRSRRHGGRLFFLPGAIEDRAGGRNNRVCRTWGSPPAHGRPDPNGLFLASRGTVPRWPTWRGVNASALLEASP